MDGSVETELKFESKRDGAVPQLSADGGVLYLVKTSRDKAGSYRVKAENEVGSTGIDFEINVECKWCKEMLRTICDSLQLCVLVE